ncbi:hypothetical protein A1O1_02738 [Capronia coronata CBS 617.96]|uniref:Uncharacterized protein n=1 Tax=Capronia coronata CBS 617.96 TaxID=1182541 RepID=W9ZIQ1_9EURO|nr:uncharacterized protein A1O1_02738 [Capronia coronata CBS 617.96]EXJ94344.1 hypothetical protein A1O1_02738 [Capronia coronata CBS 617.96]
MPGMPTRMEMIKALELSARVFGQMRQQSLEAHKAADILEMLVRKFKAEDLEGVRCLTDMQCVPSTESHEIALGSEDPTHMATNIRCTVDNDSDEDAAELTSVVLAQHFGLGEGPAPETQDHWLNANKY